MEDKETKVKPASTLAEQVRAAQANVATWPPSVQAATKVPVEYLWGPRNEPK